MIHAITRSLVFTSGAGTSRSGPMKSMMLRRVAPRHTLQFAIGNQRGIADHAALRAAERNVDHRALPGHPGRQRAHFVERHVGRVADAAFARAARDRMLHAIAREYFEPPVVQLHGNVHGDLARRRLAGFCTCRRRDSTVARAHYRNGFPPPATDSFPARRRATDRVAGILCGSFQHHFERLLNGRIGLRRHLVTLFHAQRKVIDLGLQTPFQKVAIGDPFAQAGLNLALRQPCLELVQKLRRQFPPGFDFMRADVLRGERGERRGRFKKFREIPLMAADRRECPARCHHRRERAARCRF